MHDDNTPRHRLVLSLPAKVGERVVALLDVDHAGAVIEHASPALPSGSRLRFAWFDQFIDLEIEIVTTELQSLLSDQLQQIVWHSKVHFPEEAAALREPLNRAIAEFDLQLYDAREANARGNRAETGLSAHLHELGEALSSRKPGFVSFVLRGGKWHTAETMSDEQPFQGFTLPAGQIDDAQQVTLLKLAWEEADAAGRQLLRNFAAASIDKKESAGSMEPADSETSSEGD